MKWELEGKLIAASADGSTLVHEFPGWTDEPRSLQVPTLLIFGDRDFSPLPDVVEIFDHLGATGPALSQSSCLSGTRSAPFVPGTPL
jgi:pimeloyl-ACP methyl ester carboxylesterase